MSPLPVKRAYDLEERVADRKWLIQDLWSEEAVGVLGGEPKNFKSFLALDAAVSVASGTPCLRRFHVPRAGNTLVYAAEDQEYEVRERLGGIAAAAGVDFKSLPVDVITVPVLRIDVPAQQQALRETVEQLRPKLLVLDPFVRLHRRDENVASEVAPLLAYLRELQRSYHVAVLLVHHARKGAAHARAGQALRGSSELHAWGDSNLYLRRKGDTDALTLTIEHRAASPIKPLRVALHVQETSVSLRILDDRPVPLQEPAAVSVADRIVRALETAPAPLTIRQLGKACKVRTEILCKALTLLTASARVTKTRGLYSPVSVSASSAPLQSLGSGNGKQQRELPW